MEVLILRWGEPRYEEVIGGLRRDGALLAGMWLAAESRLDEHPGKTWVVAVDAGGRALAWCAFEPADEPGVDVKAVDSYERPESWDDDLYAVVYQVRHELIRFSSAVTYVFPEPLELHLWDGWVPTVEGWSDEPGVPSHHWTRLVRAPDPR